MPKSSGIIKTPISDNKVVSPRADASTHSIQTIEYEHGEIHGGNHYFCDDVAQIPINNVLDIQWTTPNTTKWGHFTFSLQTEAETEWYAYEGVTINVAGTTQECWNNNRNSANTPGMTIAAIANTSVANANADTAVAGADQIAHGIIGAGNRSTGFEARGREIILKQNTDYCFRLIANAAGYANYVINWYEHTEKN